jgi:hypothetical protein
VTARAAQEAGRDKPARLIVSANYDAELEAESASSEQTPTPA